MTNTCQCSDEFVNKQDGFCGIVLFFIIQTIYSMTCNDENVCRCSDGFVTKQDGFCGIVCFYYTDNFFHCSIQRSKINRRSKTKTYNDNFQKHSTIQKV